MKQNNSADHFSYGLPIPSSIGTHCFGDETWNRWMCMSCRKCQLWEGTYSNQTP